jgi:hypothetical protein
MKKKIIIISSSIVVLAAGFLFLLSTQPLFENISKLCKVIDLRKTLPEGHFQKVSIVDAGDYDYVIFEVPADKVKEFEVGFRKSAPNAKPIRGNEGCGPAEVLRIQAEKGKYSAYICYAGDEVIVYGGFFHRGFVSRELRKVFYDAGLKYNSERQEAKEKEKDSNQPEQKPSE